jgi:hypothetical protein
MWTGNTETGVTVTYQDDDGTIDAVVSVSTAEVAAATLVIESEGIGSNDNDTTIPTSAAVKAYADSVGGAPATADISDVSVTQTELAELETIGATTISADQWAALGGGTTAGMAIWDDADNSAIQTTLGLVIGTNVLAPDGAGTSLTALNGENIQDDTIDDDSIDFSNVTLADFDYEPTWMMFYSNGDGDVTGRALGADETFLMSNGASAAPTFEQPTFAMLGSTPTTLAGYGITDAASDAELDAQIVSESDCSDNTGGICRDTDDGHIWVWDGDSMEDQSDYETLSSNGLVVNDDGVPEAVDIDGTSGEITVTNGDGQDGNPTIAIAAELDLGGNTSVEIPNGTNPTVDAAGEISVDTDDHMIRVYTNAQKGIPLREVFQMTIYEPDQINDEIPFFHCDSTVYPHGCTVIKTAIQLPSDAAYTMTFEEWDGDPPANQNTTEAVSTGSGDNYASSTSIDDGTIDADDHIFLDIPDTDVDWIQATVVIEAIQGD